MEKYIEMELNTDVSRGDIYKNLTNILKGTAIILLVVHHMKYANSGLLLSFVIEKAKYLIKSLFVLKIENNIQPVQENIYEKISDNRCE